MKHTDGVWRSDLLPLKIIAEPTAGGAVVVAACGGRTAEEAEANTRLLTMALQLLAELQATVWGLFGSILSASEQTGRVVLDDDAITLLRQYDQRARNLIQQIEGDT